MHWSAGYPRDPGRQTRSPAPASPSRCNRNTAFWPFAGRGTSLNAMSRLPGNNSVTLALFLRAGDWTISPFNTVCTSIEARSQAGSCSEPVRGISVARAISVTVPCTISAAAAMRWLRCNSGSMATARATSCSVFSSAGKRASSATAISSPCTHAVAKNTSRSPARTAPAPSCASRTVIGRPSRLPRTGLIRKPRSKRATASPGRDVSTRKEDLPGAVIVPVKMKLDRRTRD